MIKFKRNETKVITIAESKDKRKGHYCFTACFKWIVESHQKEKIKLPRKCERVLSLTCPKLR